MIHHLILLLNIAHISDDLCVFNVIFGKAFTKRHCKMYVGTLFLLNLYQIYLTYLEHIVLQYSGTKWPSKVVVV